MGDDFTAMNAAQRSQIDDVIGLPDQLKIMFYHNNRVSLINQTLKQLQKIINVDGMQTRRWFINQIKISLLLTLV